MPEMEDRWILKETSKEKFFLASIGTFWTPRLSNNFCSPMFQWLWWLKGRLWWGGEEGAAPQAAMPQIEKERSWAKLKQLPAGPTPSSMSGEYIYSGGFWDSMTCAVCARWDRSGAAAPNSAPKIVWQFLEPSLVLLQQSTDQSEKSCEDNLPVSSNISKPNSAPKRCDRIGSASVATCRPFGGLSAITCGYPAVAVCMKYQVTS